MLRIALFAFTSAYAQQNYPLTSMDGLKPVHVKGEPVTFKGRKALKLTETAGAQYTGATEDTMAILTTSSFQDGVIEADIAGQPGSGAGAGARGFVGIAFRVSDDHSKFELFYIRPTNGRADDQVRRNHSLQYVSAPDFPWQRLRKEFPEMYESYTDLVPGEWTKIKIEVKGKSARLFVNGATQPSLIVNDLKLGETKGQVALWLGPGTDAHYSNLRISR